MTFLDHAVKKYRKNRDNIGGAGHKLRTFHFICISLLKFYLNLITNIVLPCYVRDFKWGKNGIKFHLKKNIWANQN